MHPNYQTIKLAAGKHKPAENTGCVMEIVSCLYGEAWSDSPQCVCPALAAFARNVNDWMTDDERQLLWPFTVRLGGTNTGTTDTVRRGFRFADWAVREITPIALEAHGLVEEAARLRELPPIVDRESALRARDATTDATATASASASAASAAYAAADASAATAAYAAAAADDAAVVCALTAACLGRFAGSDRPTIVAATTALLDELCPPLPTADCAALDWDALDRLQVA